MIKRTVEEEVEELNHSTTQRAQQWLREGRRTHFISLALVSSARFLLKSLCLGGWWGRMGAWRRAGLEWYGEIIAFAKYWEARQLAPAHTYAWEKEEQVGGAYPVGVVPVSVVVIAKNEEARLKECLDSVRWAGEIIVVDDESTDGTVQVARAYTQEVFSRRMENEGAQRSFGYEKARFTWVLSLDADERVTPRLAASLREVTLSGAGAADGYSVPSRNVIRGRAVRWGGWYPNAKLRFFRRGTLSFENVEVHPRVIFRGKSGPCLEGDLVHLVYRDFHDAVRKINRQTTLEIKKWLRENRKGGPWLMLRKTLDRFLKSYFIKQGFRDGFLGLIMASFGGFYQFLSYAKYWEAKHRRDSS